MSRGPSRNKKRVLIRGGGFAGAYCAQQLEKRRNGARDEVVLINRHDYMLFYPLLIEAGIGNGSGAGRRPNEAARPPHPRSIVAKQ